MSTTTSSQSTKLSRGDVFFIGVFAAICWGAFSLLLAADEFFSLPVLQNPLLPNWASIPLSRVFLDLVLKYSVVVGMVVLGCLTICGVILRLTNPVKKQSSLHLDW